MVVGALGAVARLGARSVIPAGRRVLSKGAKLPPFVKTGAAIGAGGALAGVGIGLGGIAVGEGFGAIRHGIFGSPEENRENPGLPVLSGSILLVVVVVAVVLVVVMRRKGGR